MELTKKAEKIFPDFTRFVIEQKKSKDVFPEIPVIKYLIRKKSLEDQHWFVFLYSALDHLPMAMEMHRFYPEPDAWGQFKYDDWHWRTGVRRQMNSIPRRLYLHVTDYINTCKKYADVHDPTGMSNFYTADLFPNNTKAAKVDNWIMLSNRLADLYCNGRNISYHLVEIYRKMFKIPVVAPHFDTYYIPMGRLALAYFYGYREGNRREVHHALSFHAADLQDRLADEGVKVNMGELQMLVMQWRKMLRGKFEIGWNMNDMLHKMDSTYTRRLFSEKMYKRLLVARQKALPHPYLAELNEWQLKSYERTSAYKQHRVLLVRE